MDPNSEAIIRLAWTQAFGLDPSRLDVEEAGRVLHTRPEGEVLSVVRLGAQTLVVGPAWAVQAADSLPDDDICRVSALLQVTADHGGRALGEAALAYTDDYISEPDLESAVVTDDEQAVLDLERACPPDDVTEVGLTELTARFVLLGPGDAPLAGAGFDLWSGIIAQMGVLTARDSRRSGHGHRIAALATNAALDEGLIPQWRIPVDHDSAGAMAAGLGYQTLGHEAVVLLGDPLR